MLNSVYFPLMITRALKPGGWFEWAQSSPHLHPFDAQKKTHLFSDLEQMLIADENDMSFDVCSKVVTWFRAVGFDSVEVKTIIVPVGGESELGRMNLARLHQGVSNHSAKRLSTVLNVFCFIVLVSLFL
jgi:hypothetical protein